MRSSGQSATKAPEEKSPLSSSSLLSSERSLSPPHAWPPTHRRARVHLRHARPVPFSAHHPSPSPDSIRRPPPLSLLLSLARQSGRVFHRNKRANCSKTTCSTHTHMLTHVLMYPIRGSNSDGVVCIDRRGVGDGTRDTSLGRGREGQTKVGVRSPLVPPGPLSLTRHPLLPLSTSSILRVPPFSTRFSLAGQPLIRAVCTFPSSSIDTSISRLACETIFGFFPIYF